jgi:hypothetical protein
MKQVTAATAQLVMASYTFASPEARNRLSETAKSVLNQM